MSQIKQESNAQTRPRGSSVKQADVFHSQIQLQQSNYEPEATYRTNTEFKTIKKQDLLLPTAARGKASLFLDSRSVRPYDGPRVPDFSDLDQKRAAEFYKRQSQLKDSKIRQMTVKANHLFNKLKMYLPEEDIGVDVPFIDDNEKKIKRLENLLRIKNQEVLFKIKIQAANLLAEFQVDKADVNGINYLETQSEIFQFLMNKLKTKLQEIKGRERQTGEWRSKDKLEQERNQETIHFLTETNEILKNSQARCKLKLQQIKHQWTVTCEKVADRDRLIQERDNQIFKLKKIYQDLQGQHLRVSANERQLTLALDNQRRQAEAQIKQLRTLLTTYNLERKQLQNLLDQKDGVIEQMQIKQKYAQEEFQKVNRQYIRWKERYEWLQKEKEGKMQQYQNQLDALINQFEKYKSEFNVEELNKARSELQQMRRQLLQQRALTEKYEDDIQFMSENRIDLEEAYYKKVEALQNDYLKKSQNFQIMKHKHIEQVVRMRAEEETAKIQELEAKWKRKLEDQETLAKKKIQQIQQLNIQRFAEKENDICTLEEEVAALNEKLSEKDKLISVLYPKLGFQDGFYDNNTKQ